MMSDALCRPVAFGVNLTLTVQLRAGANVAPHRLTIEKLVGLVPPNVMLLSVSATGPAFVNVNVE
jgi:hypothetical protein